MANREQHVGIDFKNSTIAINGTTTASKYLGTDANGDLEWKDGGGGGKAISGVAIWLAMVTDTTTGDTKQMSAQVRITFDDNTYVEDTDQVDLSVMTCPDDCPQTT